MTTMIPLIAPSKSSIEISEHAQMRCQQRGISEWDVNEVLTYGEVMYKQGMTFHFLTKRDIEKYYKPAMHEQLKDLIVLKCSDGIVVTAYKQANSIHNIKCKSKRLSRKGKYASQNKRNAQRHRALAAMAA